jgi:hypothetical protein
MLCIRNEKGAILSQLELRHTLVGFERWDCERRKLGVYPGECPFAIETGYNLLVDLLVDRGYRVYVIPPKDLTLLLTLSAGKIVMAGRASSHNDMPN